MPAAPHVIIEEGPGPRVTCRPLSAFNPANLAATRAAFADATPLALGQAWQPVPSPGFAPATVRTGWRADLLLVFAELTDHDIHTAATDHNQRLWELGDTFEIFLRPVTQTAYFEFHVTPRNLRLQLSIPNTAALRAAQRANTIEPFLMPGAVFTSAVWIEAAASRWSLLAEIPAEVVAGRPGPAPDERWRFSFSRYDYTRGVPTPVLSSTSPHARADFHSQAEWGWLRFADR